MSDDIEAVRAKLAEYARCADDAPMPWCLLRFGDARLLLARIDELEADRDRWEASAIEREDERIALGARLTAAESRVARLEEVVLSAWDAYDQEADEDGLCITKSRRACFARHLRAALDTETPTAPRCTCAPEERSFEVAYGTEMGIRGPWHNTACPMFEAHGANETPTEEGE